MKRFEKIAKLRQESENIDDEKRFNIEKHHRPKNSTWKLKKKILEKVCP